MEHVNTKEMNLYLIRLGEISLKGLNRNFFEKKLKNNIKLKIHPYRSLLTREKGRFYLYVSKDCPEEIVIKTLKTTFGVVGFSKALVCEKDWPVIVENAKALIENEPFADGTGSFKVECRRGDKSFFMNSYQIEAELGGVVRSMTRDSTLPPKRVKSPPSTPCALRVCPLPTMVPRKIEGKRLSVAVRSA